MGVVLEHLTDAAGSVHVENHPISTFVRFSVPYDVHAVLVPHVLPRMQPVACLKRKMLERHQLAYGKQVGRQIKSRGEADALM